MRSRRKSELVAAIAAALIAATATSGCNTAGCTDNRNSLPLAGFASSTTLRNISIDSVRIAGIGAPGDSALNRPYQPTSSVYLPLRSTAQTTSFEFRYMQKQLAAIGLSDTLTFNYTSEPRFVSEECGAMYVYHITSLTHTRWMIDSVAILDSTITNLDIERIKIFYPTATGDND